MSKCATGSKTRNELLEHKSKEKAKKTVDMEEIRAELRGTMGGKHHYLIDDEEEEGDEDVHIYVSG